MVMAFFEELNGIVMGTLGEYVLKNQRLCKLLYYYPDEKTPNYDPFIQPDIEDTTQLMFTHVFPVPKLPDAVLDQKGYLACTLTGGNSVETNTGFRIVNIQFDIIYHLKAWAIKGGLRPYFVASEIDKMFNNKSLTLPIINRSQYYGFRMKDYSSYFYGIQLIYSLYVDSNVGCVSTIPMYQDTPFIGNINSD